MLVADYETGIWNQQLYVMDSYKLETLIWTTVIQYENCILHGQYY